MSTPAIPRFGVTKVFSHWLVCQRKRTDHVGDLARDFSRDPNRPAHAGPHVVGRYLEHRGIRATRTLQVAFQEWRLRERLARRQQ